MNNQMHDIRICPACKAKNKLPAERNGAGARCGKCGTALVDTQAALVLRCVQCKTKNRVPPEKRARTPKCGKCHAPLQTEDIMTAWAVPVTDAVFDEKVLRSPLPVLVEAVSPTCGACTVSAPVVNRLASEWRGRVRVCRMDVTTSPAAARRYQLMSTPTFLVFDGGRLVDSAIGAVPREVLVEKMAVFLK